MSKILEIQNLSVTLNQKQKTTQLVSGVNFNIEKGQCIGILGESGSGKSMLCKGIMGLLDRNFDITGRVLFDEMDLNAADQEQRRKYRGKDMGMILQNPMTCFDPLYTIGYQMNETFKVHTYFSKKEINEKIIRTLNLMQIENPEDVIKKYPHQLSGGMLQRVMIGLSLALNPKLIIADEPTTDIDSITQFEIIKEFIRIKKEHEVAMIFVSHDLGVIAKVADYVLVMHNGEVVDEGSVEDIFQHATNSYTRDLVEKRMQVMSQFKDVLSKRKRKEGRHGRMGRNSCPGKRCGSEF
ncbi:MAG TPA: ABC transporter ATP-binding protein [Epulopiscium sp.]|nr:ABC transporter ATP-binding protein [Candidatus Epulonipiscium sp.]